MSCHACDRIAKIRAGDDAGFIAELSESFVVLGDQQFYRGWCVLHLKDHEEHLARLPFDRQARLWNDVMRVADAITRILNPKRLNHECLGNTLHHIHWHLIPRYANDPEPLMPVWNHVKSITDPTTTEERAALVEQLRTHLARPNA